jgi:hypothetical protein
VKIMPITKTIYPEHVALRRETNEQAPSNPILPSRFSSTSGLESIPVRNLYPVESAPQKGDISPIDAGR